MCTDGITLRTNRVKISHVCHKQKREGRAGHTDADLQPADNSSVFIKEENSAKTDGDISAPNGGKGQVVDWFCLISWH